MPDVSFVESSMYSPDEPKWSPTKIARILAALKYRKAPIAYQPLMGAGIDRVSCRIVSLVRFDNVAIQRTLAVRECYSLRANYGSCPEYQPDLIIPRHNRYNPSRTTKVMRESMNRNAAGAFQPTNG